MEDLPGAGMGKLELPGMQEMPLEVVSLTVEGVAGNGVTERLKMDADLVGASRAGHAGHKGPSILGGQQLIVGDGIASRGGAARGHLLTLYRVAADRQIDRSLGVTGSSADDG